MRRINWPWKRSHRRDRYVRKGFLEFGRHSYGGEDMLIAGSPAAPVRIGKFCSIAPGLIFYAQVEHRTEWVSTYPFGMTSKEVFPALVGRAARAGTKGPIVIGNDVWIGQHVSVMSGVTVGDGAVLAAHSHVVADVPPYGIVGGNPAKLLKRRFDDEQIAALLAARWWDLPDEAIDELSPFLRSEDIDVVLAETARLSAAVTALSGHSG
ncbi:MAG: antibiotic acetyltransferase [Alphaproteobacteria bacterium]|nr:antibiotic acetyltransferase [Alphaproteobacteria bacterium]